MTELYGLEFAIVGSFSYYDSSKGCKRESQDTKKVLLDSIGNNKIFNKQTLMTRILWIISKYNYADRCSYCNHEERCKRCFELWSLFFQLLGIEYYKKRDYEEDSEWDDEEKKKNSIDKIKKFKIMINQLHNLEIYNHKKINDIFSSELGQKYINTLFEYVTFEHMSDHKRFISFKVYNKDFKEYKFHEGYAGKCKDDIFTLKINVTQYILETN
jgi:hypothetical protein